MIKDKYYIPSIEDLFVGYECGILGSAISEDGAWIMDMTGASSSVASGRLGKWQLEKILGDWYDWEGRLRTSYLTKEQIEAEGWEQVHGYHYKNGTRVYIFGTRLTFQVHDQILFQGNTPSINEFRKISKLLNIN